MHTIKIKVVYKSAPKSVWRTFYVSPDIKLDELGAGIVAAFNGDFEHSFNFNVNRNEYYYDSEMLKYMLDFASSDDMYDMAEHTLQELLDKKRLITMCYDSGEDHTFSIKRIDGEKEIIEDIEESDFIDDDYESRNIFLDKGRGFGIYENNRYLMERVLLGHDINDICDDMGITPDDLYNDFPLTIEEYFKPLDIEELDDSVACSFFIYKECQNF